MELTTTKEGDVLIVTPSGRIDGTNAREFEAAFQEKLAEGDSDVLVDFEGVDFISSAGLRVLLMVAKQVKAKSRKMELCSMRDYLKEVFDVSGFNAIFPTHANRSIALGSLTSESGN